MSKRLQRIIDRISAGQNINDIINYKNIERILKAENKDIILNLIFNSADFKKDILVDVFSNIKKEKNKNQMIEQILSIKNWNVLNVLLSAVNFSSFENIPKTMNIGKHLLDEINDDFILAYKLNPNLPKYKWFNEYLTYLQINEQKLYAKINSKFRNILENHNVFRLDQKKKEQKKPVFPKKFNNKDIHIINAFEQMSQIEGNFFNEIMLYFNDFHKDWFSDYLKYLKKKIIHYIKK